MVHNDESERIVQGVGTLCTVLSTQSSVQGDKFRMKNGLRIKNLSGLLFKLEGKFLVYLLECRRQTCQQEFLTATPKIMLFRALLLV